MRYERFMEQFNSQLSEHNIKKHNEQYVPSVYCVKDWGTMLTCEIRLLVNLIKAMQRRAEPTQPWVI